MAADDGGSADNAPPSESGERRWNLGKNRERKVEVKAPRPVGPVAPLPGAPTPPPSVAAAATGGGAKLAIPRQPQAQRPATENESSSIIVPGRPVPRPKSAREWMNHPITIVACGLAICVSAVVWVSTLSGGSMEGDGKDTVTLTDETRVGAGVVNLAGEGKRDGSGEVVATAKFDAGDAPVREGRMILSTGEMLIAVANFMSQDKAGSLPPSDLIFAPMGVLSAPLPPADSIEFNIARAQQGSVAQDVVDTGAKAVELARARAIAPDRIRRVGTRLVAEGLAVLDGRLANPDARRMINDAMPQVGLPGIEGAAAKVSTVATDVTTDEIRDLATQILPDYYAGELMTVRAKHFQ